MMKMNEKLTALYIGVLWVQTCGKHFRSTEGESSRIRIGFNTFMKEVTREVPVLHEFQKIFIVYSCHSRTHWWEYDSA